MVTIKDMHEQNHQIAELAKTLSYLFQDREMCDSGVTCELFERYRDKFDSHLTNNKEVYSVLLNSHGEQGRKVADRFISGEIELKKLLKDYAAKWCKNGLSVGDHEKFLIETSQLFDMVWNRIQAENEQLYPLVRDQIQVA